LLHTSVRFEQAIQCDLPNLRNVALGIGRAYEIADHVKKQIGPILLNLPGRPTVL